MQATGSVWVLRAEDLQQVRKLVKALLAQKQSVKGLERITSQLLSSISTSKSCSCAAAVHLIEVIQLSSSAAVYSVLTASTPSLLRKHLAPAVVRNSQRQPRTLLVREMKKWCALGEHDRSFIKHFQKLCWYESLKTIHQQLAQTRMPTKEKQHHTFQARLADVRSEILADICSMQQMRDEACPPRSDDRRTYAKVPSCTWKSSGWCGVNLGGWLLWEPGPANNSDLIASLGADADIPDDEWTLCEQLILKYGQVEAEALMHKHRSTHVTREDFIKMKQLGVNAVRVPFGYWAIAGPGEGEPFIGPCVEFLDAALRWGDEVGLSVILCYHSAVGFQSYDPPCGRHNEKWKPKNFNVAANVEVMRQVAKRFGNHPALGGICILNEPHGDLPAKTLNSFFEGAYSVMRGSEQLPESVQLMLPVFHHEFTSFAGRYTPQKGFVNVVFDVHCYQVFGDPYAGWCRMSLAEHLRYAIGKASSHPITGIVKRNERVVVTEFSLGLPVWDKKYMISREFAALTGTEKKLLMRSFALRQLSSFATYTEGWFFWCWKDDSGPEWSLSESMSKGWMPALSSGDMNSADTASSSCGETEPPSSPCLSFASSSDISAPASPCDIIEESPAPHGQKHKILITSEILSAKRARMQVLENEVAPDISMVEGL